MRMILALTAFLAATTAGAADPVKAGPAADEVKKLDAAVSEAAVKRDVKALDRHTAAEYVLTDPGGAVSDKKALLEGFRSGACRLESMKDSEVRAAVYGETAVLTGRMDLKGKVQNQDVSGPYRWTRVYVKRDGRWQMAAEQLTRIVQP